jgi:hypothetical protein
MEDCDQVGIPDYNVSLQVSALFIVFGVSLCGAMLPVLLKASKRFAVSDYFFLCFKTCGIGVILVHSLLQLTFNH